MKKLFLAAALLAATSVHAAPKEFCVIHARMGGKIAEMRDTWYYPRFIVQTAIAHKVNKLPKSDQKEFIKHHVVHNLFDAVYDDPTLKAMSPFQVYGELYSSCLVTEIESYE